jgi:tetratricopeptide (TPR) repeat protein
MNPRNDQVANALIATQAVGQVAAHVSAAGWLFRDQPTNDFGIDAHAEMADGGRATGRLVAIQVKGGSTAFAYPTEGGWYFPVKANHARYWLGHSLPVALVLAEISDGQSYWQAISAETLVSTGKNFKVFVPEAQRVQGAGPAWSALTTQYFEDARLRFEANISIVPASARDALVRLAEAHRRDAEVLSMALAAGRHQPEVAVSDLLLTRASWLDTLPVHAWVAVASFARDHDLGAAAARASIAAGAIAKDQAAKYYAHAAIAAHAIDEKIGLQALRLARETDPTLTEALVASAIWGVDVDAAERELARRTGGWVDSYFGHKAVLAKDHNEAVRRFQQLVQQEPESEAAHLQLAAALAHRSVGPAPEPSDARKSADHARIALDGKRKWSDSVEPELGALLRALIFDERWTEVLESLRLPPRDLAVSRELGNASIARMGIEAAKRSNQVDIAQRFAEGIEDPQDRQLALDELNSDPEDLDAQINILERRLARAAQGDDPRELVGIVGALAGQGRDETEALARLVAEGWVEQSHVDLLGLIARSHHAPFEVLPLLRSTARANQLAAATVVRILRDHDTVVRAIDACRSYYATFHSQMLLEELVQLLVRAGDFTSAAAALEDALRRGLLAGDALRRAHARLGSIYADRGEWENAAEQFRSALGASGSLGREVAWNLVVCFIRVGDDARARSVVDEQGLEPESDQQLRAWFHVIKETGWNDETARAALTLSSREGVSSFLAGAMLTSIVRETRGTPPETDENSGQDDDIDSSVDARPVVEGSIHRRAFEILNDLMSTHGPEFPMWKISVGTTRDEIMEALKTQLGEAPDDRPVRDVIKLVSRGEAPLGMLCEIRRDPYSHIAARRDVRVTSHLDDDLDAAETAAAHAARDGRVVIDLTAIDASIELGRWDEVVTCFSSVVLCASQKSDIAQGVRSAQNATASSMSIGLDRHGIPRVSREDPASQIATLRRTEAIEAASRMLEIRTVEGDLTMTGRWEELGRPAWLDSIELASREGVPLWSDDLGHRRVAQGLGLATFSTVNLLQAQILRRLDANPTDADIEQVVEDQAKLHRALIEHRFVDQPTTEADLHASIAAHAGVLSPAVEVVARRSWWSGHETLEWWPRVAESVRTHSSATLRTWQAKTMVGLLEVAAEGEGPRHVAVLAILGCGPSPDLEDATEGMLMADEICADYGRPAASDSLAWALASLKIKDPEEFARLLTEAMSTARANAGIPRDS